MDRKSETAYIGLGSNLGDRRLNLENAIDMLARTGGISLIARSSIYETKPVGLKNQPDFLNCAVEVLTGLSPYELLYACMEIERKLKRVRGVRWGPRTADLDILFYGSLVMDEEKLKIPHPRISERGFVLVPMAEIAPELLHPERNLTINELLSNYRRNAGQPEDVILFERI